MLIAALFFACTPDPSDTAVEPDTDTEAVTVSLSMVAFNVEGRDSNPEGLASSAMDAVVGEALWALSEVPNQRFLDDLAVNASGDPETPFASVLGTTGGNIRLGMVWDPEQLTLVRSYELDALSIGDYGRAPLVGHFETVLGGYEMLVVTNHFWRSEMLYRHEQAELLNAWALDQQLPAVTLGDFNFDWRTEGGDDDHDRGYDLLTEGDVWAWVRPDDMLMTHCNSRYNSVLDFVFVAGLAQDWHAETTVLEPRPSYCRDDETRSDHRPVRADFVIGPLQ